MATLFITEFEQLGIDNRGGLMQVPLVPSLADQTVAVGATSTQSAAFNVATRFIRVISDVACTKKIGTNPTATTTTMRLPADSAEYFQVPPGGTYKLAVLAA